MNHFYVYAHFRATDGRLFYIGKGSGNRAWARYGRNRHWKAIHAKHGRRVRIVIEGLSETEAFRVEALLIAARPGVLATYTSGGSGTSGYRHTERAKRAISEKRTGKKLSEAARKRLSDTIRSNPDLLAKRAEMFRGEANPAKKVDNRRKSSARMEKANPMLCLETREKMKASRAWYRATPETRAKIGAALRGRVRGPVLPHVAAALATAREKRKRAVVTACGLYFESTAEAARVTGAGQGNIVNNCTGRAKSAGGYKWSYADEN